MTTKEQGADGVEVWRGQGVIDYRAALGASDMLVVGRWLHVEMKDDDTARVQLGDRTFLVTIPTDGGAAVVVEPDPPRASPNDPELAMLIDLNRKRLPPGFTSAPLPAGPLPDGGFPQLGYDAYGAKADWKAYDGNPMPRWDVLPLHIQERWAAAANAIHDAVADMLWPEPSPSPNTPELEAAIEKARAHGPLTDAEREEQIRSFATGNVGMENPKVTRAVVDQVRDRLPKE